MKYRITSGKVYGPDGPMKIGDVLDIEGDVPAGLVGRVEAMPDEDRRKPADDAKPAATGKHGRRKKWKT